LRSGVAYTALLPSSLIWYRPRGWLLWLGK